ncbi:hypothetical protein HYW99_01595 [Candidatus Woesearchaeota archaeon]|nr:hypothetical protein [Candidatus Woesearchaeota archaeon]
MGIEVKTFQVTTGASTNGKTIVPTAAIEAKINGKEVSIETAIGTGPIDALYKAVNRAIGQEVGLKYFRIELENSGSETYRIAEVEVVHKDRTYKDRARSSDEIESALHAYINALNQIQEGQFTKGYNPVHATDVMTL